MSSLPTANHALGDDGAWTLWRDIALRGTGFPIALLDDLADTALAQAVTAHLNADDGLAETMQQARRACHARLQDTADPTARRAWRRVMQTLQAGRAAEPTGDADFDALLAGLATAIAAAADGCQRFGQAFDAADAQTLAHLHRMADDARLREALAWQNPQALLTALAPLQRHVHEGRRNAEDRQHERLLTRYLQRYAAKNDTIGFFGPAGWAQVQGPGAYARAAARASLGHRATGQRRALGRSGPGRGIDPRRRRAPALAPLASSGLASRSRWRRGGTLTQLSTAHLRTRSVHALQRSHDGGRDRRGAASAGR
ncbi:MAG: lantibiotic dehydratase [Rubrivivax sp.]|nr:lantibiotic dehydratase [Rubrivivax sp.]